MSKPIDSKKKSFYESSNLSHPSIIVKQKIQVECSIPMPDVDYISYNSFFLFTNSSTINQYCFLPKKPFLSKYFIDK